MSGKIFDENVFNKVYTYHKKYKYGMYFPVDKIGDKIEPEEWLNAATRDINEWHSYNGALDIFFLINSMQAGIRIKADIIKRDYCL